MKKYLFIPLICLVLFLSTCENKKEQHFFVTLINQSDYDVYLCKRFTDFEGKCNLNRGGTLEKNSSKEYQPFNSSIEQALGGMQVLELYFVNPKHYNDNYNFYDCDSIPIKNDILMHCRLTLKELQQMNFIIIFS